MKFKSTLCAFLIVAIAAEAFAYQRCAVGEVLSVTPHPPASTEATTPVEPTPKPTAWPALHFLHDVVFTTSIGSDDATNVKIAVELAWTLQERSYGGRRLVNDAMVVPSVLGLADIQAQCADPHVLGFYVALPASTVSSKDNLLILDRSFTEVKFSIAIFKCHHSVETQGTNASAVQTPNEPVVLFVSNLSRGIGARYSISLVPIAFLASIYSTIVPTRLSQSVTTRQFPVPSPVPAGGALSQVQTTSATTLNPSSVGSLGTSVLSLVGGASANVGQIAATDPQLSRAIRDALGHLVAEQLAPFCFAPAPGRIGGDSAGDFCRW